MALRSPIYLDTETLLAQAEYNDLDVPHVAEVVETTRSKRSGGGKLGFSGFGAEGTVGNDVEMQSTYTLTPREKATVSKVIDALVKQGSIKVNVNSSTVISRDDLVEIEGLTRITSASLAGKAFYILRRIVGDLTGAEILAAGSSGVGAIMSAEDFTPAIFEQFKKVYLDNELLPVPILLEVTGHKLPCRVYANLAPDHFVDAASKDRVEGDVRVLGIVSQIVADGDDGFFSAEKWLLHDWEYMVRRLMMTNIEGQVSDLMNKMGVEQVPEDVHASIAGPAIIVDAVAIY